MVDSSSKNPEQTCDHSRIAVLGGHFAPLALYQQIEQQVASSMKTIIAGRLYTLKEIIGEAQWDVLPSNWAKRMAGRCFAHMVSTSKFPLKFVKYKRYATKRYQVKTD